MSRDRQTQGSGTPNAVMIGLGARQESGLAPALHRLGMEVRTETATVGGLRLDRGTRLVFHGPDVSREHPIRLGALRRGIEQFTPERWLAETVGAAGHVVVAGDRQASRTAAMLRFILEYRGIDDDPRAGTPAASSNVLDWDGSLGGLAKGGPHLSVLIQDEGRDGRDSPWSDGLRGFAEESTSEANVLASGRPSEWAGRRPNPGWEWLSMEPGGNWWGTDVREVAGRCQLRVFHDGNYVNEVKLQVPGRGQVICALAAVAACGRLGIPQRVTREALEDYPGMARDFEVRGSFRGVTLVDDASDDARGVAEAIGLARTFYNGRKLRVVYALPSGRKLHADLRGIATALTSADRVLVLSRDSHEDGSEVDQDAAGVLLRSLDSGGVAAGRATDLEEVIGALDQEFEPGDVLLTLGAGDVGTIADAFIRRLPRHRQAG